MSSPSPTRGAGATAWFDAWAELVGTLQRNPLRTALTAAGVAWGMFLLVMLTSAGTGLATGVQSSLGRRATNAVYFWARNTSLPYGGHRPGRPIHFTNADIEAVRAEVSGIRHAVPTNQLGGWRGKANVRLGTRIASASVTGEVPEIWHIKPTAMRAGRFLNARDLSERRRVAVVGQGLVPDLLPQVPDAAECLVGQRISIDGSWFLVVGVFESLQSGETAERAESAVHLPLSTFQQAFRQGERIRWFALSGEPDASAAAIEADAQRVLRARHGVHPDDAPAIGSRNAEAEYRRVQATSSGIRAFVLLVGVLTLLAGAFGVTNVMLVSVGERTREIGLRRAVGASAGQVRRMILREALLLTVLAGQVGLLAGVLALEVLRWWVGPDHPTLGQSQVEAGMVVLASGFMVLAGAVAGYLPAARAAAIHPVEALRSG